MDHKWVVVLFVVPNAIYPLARPRFGHWTPCWRCYRFRHAIAPYHPAICSRKFAPIDHSCGSDVGRPLQSARHFSIFVVWFSSANDCDGNCLCYTIQLRRSQAQRLPVRQLLALFSGGVRVFRDWTGQPSLAGIPHREWLDNLQLLEWPARLDDVQCTDVCVASHCIGLRWNDCPRLGHSH